MCPAAASATVPALIFPRVVSTPSDLVAALQEARDLAVLDDVHAELVRAARITPRDVVVARDAAPALQRRTEDRIPDLGRDVDDRQEGLQLGGLEPFRVDVVGVVRGDAPLQLADVVEAVREVDDAALAQHHVEVELVLERLPELQAELVDRRALVPQVVRAHDRRVAAHVPAAEPAPLEHGHVRDAVVLREVVGRRETMPAGADDDDVVRVLRIGGAPEPLDGVRVRRPGRAALGHRPIIASRSRHSGPRRMRQMPVPASARPILVVDDDAKIVSLVRTYLEREGFEVVEARDGRSALALIAAPRSAAGRAGPDAARDRRHVRPAGGSPPDRGRRSSSCRRGARSRTGSRACGPAPTTTCPSRSHRQSSCSGSGACSPDRRPAPTPRAGASRCGWATCRSIESATRPRSTDTSCP